MYNSLKWSIVVVFLGVLIYNINLSHSLPQSFKYQNNNNNNNRKNVTNNNNINNKSIKTTAASFIAKLTTTTTISSPKNNITKAITLKHEMPTAEALHSDPMKPAYTRKKQQYHRFMPKNDKYGHVENDGRIKEVDYEKKYEKEGNGGYDNREEFNHKENSDYDSAKRKTMKYPNNLKTMKSSESEEGEYSEEEENNSRRELNTENDKKVPANFMKRNSASVQNRHGKYQRRNDEENDHGKPKIKRHNSSERIYRQPRKALRPYKVRENSNETGNKNKMKSHIKTRMNHEVGYNGNPMQSSNGYQAFVFHDLNGDASSGFIPYEDPERSDTRKSLSKQHIPLSQPQPRHPLQAPSPPPQFLNYDYPLLNVRTNNKKMKPRKYEKPPIAALRDKLKVDYGDEKTPVPTNFNDKYDDIDYGERDTGRQYKPVPYNYEDDVVDVGDDEEVGNKDEGKQKKVQSYADDYGYDDDGEGDGNSSSSSSSTSSKSSSSSSSSSNDSDNDGDTGGGGEAQNAEYDDEEEDSEESGGAKISSHSTHESDDEDDDDEEGSENKKKDDDDDYF